MWYVLEQIALCLVIEGFIDSQSFQIDFERRRIGDDGSDCLISVDGTHCPFEAKGRRWYSHKFKASGVAYEVALCIKTGEIVWLNGPFPAGEYNDLKMFRMALKYELDPNERVAADKGYAGECPLTAKTPGPLYSDPAYVKMMSDVSSRHESVNNRLKMFECLKQRFRHGVRAQAACFRAVAVLVQLQIQYDEPLFTVQYTDK
jgi:DDE superfamily endonuclease